MPRKPIAAVAFVTYFPYRACAVNTTYDVFVSYSSLDREVVRPLAERLRADGLRVWFDQWEIQPGDSIPAKLEEGLEYSRVLVFCMSANVVGSDWTRLESGTFRFRDPMNKSRRFIPVRLDHTEAPGSLAQFSYIDWRDAKSRTHLSKMRDEEYQKLLRACRKANDALLTVTESPSGQITGSKAQEVNGPRNRSTTVISAETTRNSAYSRSISLGHTANIRSVALSADGKRALSGAEDNTLRLWDLQTNQGLQVLEGHSANVFSVALSADGKRALSCAGDNTVRLWELETSRCIQALDGHGANVLSIALSADGKLALLGADDKTVRLWELEIDRCVRVLEGHTASVRSVALGMNGKLALSGSTDHTLRLWDVETSQCLQVLEGHNASVLSVALSADGTRALSGAGDNALRFWNLETRECLHVMQGHGAVVYSVALSADCKLALSGAGDNTLRLWDLTSGRALKLLNTHSRVSRAFSVALSADGKRALSGATDKTLQLWDLESNGCRQVSEGHTAEVWFVALRADGKQALSGAGDSTLRLWDVETGRCIQVLNGHHAYVLSVALSADGDRALSGAADNTVRLWDLKTGFCIHVLEGHSASVSSVALSADGKWALSGAADNTVRLWDLKTGRCIHVLESHKASVTSVALSANGKLALSGARDKTLRLWDVETGCCIHVLEGHSASVSSVALSEDGKRALSGAGDKTLRFWDMETGRCIHVLEGHSASVSSVALSSDRKQGLSGAEDRSLRMWDLENCRCLNVLTGHTDSVRSVALSTDGSKVFSSARNGVLRIWDLAGIQPEEAAPDADIATELPYANAKVLLVGDSGVGKTGLTRYLAHGIRDDGSNSSTDGVWATHLALPHESRDPVEREIWLWDFAGQVDYRLVHQLFMDDAAVAVLVFNPQNENLFDGLGQWDRDLRKATRGEFARLLAAGRVDRGSLVVSRANLESFMKERGFRGELHETSARTGQGCDRLHNAILEIIDWKTIPTTASPRLYRRMKEEILRLRDEGLVLLRLAELKQRMELALPDDSFDLAQLETVVSLLAGPGMIGRVDFGDFVLLRPELLSRYAAALVRKVRQHPQELGCLGEDELFAGELDYQDFKRLPNEIERIILRHLHDTLVSRAWCLRQPCDGTVRLTFPSYFRRERPEQPGHPNIRVSYRFVGPVDEIYATLVVRLHHTAAFETEQLWKSAADFKTQTGKRLGVLLTRESEGGARLDAYFDSDVAPDTRVLFERYVHDHLMAYAQNAMRLRHYTCSNKKCESYEQPFLDRAKIDKALAPGGKGKVFCPDCGRPIQLRDETELLFVSPEVKEQARKLEGESQFNIDNESRELLAVHHAGFIVAEAGQIYRPIPNSDHGIDAEIEFKDEVGRATGHRLYLQLKSGDSYLTERKRDGAEIFKIKNPRWATYWQQHAYPVMLVIRNADGIIRWMDISKYLRHESVSGNLPTQIVFEGERLDVMSVRRYRDLILRHQATTPTE